MSFGIDVNILLYASDESSNLHAEATAFLQRCAEEREVFCLAWITIAGYLRMTTHPSIFARPLRHDDAMQNISALLELPHCRIVGEQQDFWNTYRAVTTDVPTRGNLVPDAHLASILRQNGVKTLYTHDRDFRKFSFLDIRDPLS